MVAEYAAEYGGPPAPTMAWVLFLALVNRTPMFQARRQLAAWDATAAAIGGAFGDAGALTRERGRLESAAYPTGKAAKPVFLPNAFAEDSNGEA